MTFSFMRADCHVCVHFVFDCQYFTSFLSSDWEVSCLYSCTYDLEICALIIVCGLL